MRKVVTVPLLITLVLLLGDIGQVRATIINNTTGIPSPVSTITFDEHVLPQNTVLTNQYADVGVTFNNLFYAPQDYTAPNFSYPDAGNFVVDGNVNPQFSIHFTADRTSAAVALITNPGQTTTITALENGVPVASQAFATTTSNPDFYGFTNLIFNEISFSVTGDHFALIDNIQLGQAAPEPNTLVLIGPGAIGLFAAARRRRKA